MSHVPTLCDACYRVSLVPFQSVAQGKVSCPSCGGERRVVPSCSYAREDAELFEELGDAVGDGLTPLEAHRLGIEVGRALWSGSLSELFDALAVRWASLVPLVLVTGSNQGHQRRVLLILKTIFEAMALARRSGTMPAVMLPAALPRVASNKAS